MCLNPITIKSNARYYSPFLTAAYNEVPCGRCAACRDARKSVWEDRLCLEVSDWYKNGGIGIMLTFTYNDACLPHFERDGVSVPCFSPVDISAFLNRVKVRSARTFGVDFYRYFICSEYGKNTKRPHYHAIFLIRDPQRYVEFIEMCRSLWCWLFERDRKGHFKPATSLGFMFPKRKYGRYVDDKGRDRDPRFKSKKAGAIYVCKYVCKDLAYFNLPVVKEFYDTYPEFRNYCPRSWKSNNLGFPAVERALAGASSKEIQAVLQRGVWSPLQNKFVKLWDTAVNRLMYDNVHVDLYSIKTHKKVYERFLSSFGCEWLWFNFKARVERTMQKMYERALLVSKHSDLSDMFHFDINRFFIRSDFKRFALWHCLLKQFSFAQLSNFALSVDNDIDAFFDIDSWKDVFILKHDNANLSTFVFETSLFPSLPVGTLDVNIFLPYQRFEATYKALCIFLSRCNIAEYTRRSEQIVNAKHSSGVYGFDENLC